MKRLIERLLIRLGILATPEQDEYFAWADVRLDHLMGDHSGCGPDCR